MSKKQQKILFINYEYPPLGGGGGNATRQIARELVKKDCLVSVLTSRFKGLPNHENDEGVNIIRIPTLRRYQEKCCVFEMIVFMISSVFYALSYLFKKKPDHIICFFSIPCGPAALMFKLLYGVPYIVALRGGDVPGFLPEQLATFHKMSNWLTHIVWRFSNTITTNSHGLANLAQKFYPKKTVEIIPNGVSAFFYFQRKNEKKADKLKLLTVGRLSVQKHVERLIHVMARLDKTIKGSIELKIAGDGPEKKHLESLAEKSGVLNKSVFFLGWRQRQEVRWDYQKADVFVLASDYEGMPNVMLEAMASGLAIVATNAPGTNELVTDGVNGNLIPFDQLELFDSVLTNLFLERAQLALYQHESFKVAKKYTWQQVAHMYLELIQKNL